MQFFESRISLVDNYFERTDLYSYKENFKGKNILVTGGAGAIGSNLVIFLSRLVGDEGKVVILDNLSSNKLKNTWNVIPLENILFVKGDIREKNFILRCFQEKIDIVYHLAAFFANQNSIDYPNESADVDVLGLINLLEISLVSKVEKFIYASSGCAIYGSYPQLPLVEDYISMHLTTPYQINKMTGEMYCNYYYHHFGLPIVNCRFFNSYGPGEVPGQYRNVIPNFMYWMKLGKDIPLTGEGNETRDFTSVLDLCQGLIKSCTHQQAVGENFNLAAGSEITIKNLISSLGNAFEKEYKIVRRPRRKWDTKPRILASIEKAQKRINYKPIISFEEGFKDTFEWFNDNWEEILSLADFPPGLNSAVRKSL